MVIISYFIPEDGDTSDHPNVFVIDGNSITLGQIKKKFPVPGDYHFRFKKSYGSRSVWLDVTDDNVQVPVEDSRVLAKITRLDIPSFSSYSNSNPTQSYDSSSSNITNDKSQSQQPSARKERLLSFDQNEEDSNNIFSSSNSSQPAVENPQRRKSEKLLNFDQFEDDNFAAPANKGTAFDNNDFLGFSAAPSTQTTKAAAPVDFFSMQSTAAPSNQNNMFNTSQPPNTAMRNPNPMQQSQQHIPMMGATAGRGVVGGNNGFDAFSNLNDSRLNPMMAQQNAYNSNNNARRK